MKPRDRTINVFSISFLDVISGALGAFLIVMIVLFPYYRKEHIDYRAEIQALAAELEEARQEIERARQEAEAARREADAARQAAEDARREADDALARAEAAEERLRRTFLVVVINWGTRQDVDLHVVDPTGAEFNWRSPTVAGRPGELSEDNTTGPGTEVWQVDQAETGEYRVYANLFSRHEVRDNPEVRGRVYHRGGSEDLATVVLTEASGAGTPRLVLMGRILVDAGGNVRLQ